MMTKINRKLWVGLLIPVAIIITGVVGGIEWAFASLGIMVLIGILGISIYVLAKVLRHSSTLLKGGCSEYGSISAPSFDGNDLKYVTYNKPAEAAPISKEDKRLIMKHIDELFTKDSERSREKLAEAVPISEQDKRLIMWRIDEFFTKGLGQSEGKPF